MPPEDCAMTVHVTYLLCPKCGSLLLRIGSRVWCSFVGDQRPGGQEACDFGVAEMVPADDPRIVRVERTAVPAWEPAQQDEWNILEF